MLAGRLPGARPPALVVIDLQDQALADPWLDALFATGARVVAVAGAADESDSRLRARPWARWLRRPITLGAIADVA